MTALRSFLRDKADRLVAGVFDGRPLAMVSEVDFLLLAVADVLYALADLGHR